MKILRTNMKFYIFLNIFLFLSSCKAMAQLNREGDLTDELTYFNNVQITIDYFSERYHRTEINVFYWLGDSIKIHSVVKEPSKAIDTTFSLTGNQISFLNQAEKDIRQGKISSDELVVAGTKISFTIVIGNERIERKGVVDYSLLKELIKVR